MSQVGEVLTGRPREWGGSRLECQKKNNKVSETKVLSDDLKFEAKEDNKHHEISEFIKKLELDDLSPKESLDILYTLKKNYFFE